MSEYQSPSSSSSLSKVNNNKTLLLKGGGNSASSSSSGSSSSNGAAHTKKGRGEEEVREEREKSVRPQDLSKAVIVEKTNSKEVVGTSSSTSRVTAVDKETNKKSNDDEVNSVSKREKVDIKNLNMLSNPIENHHYSREPDLRYTSLSDVSRSISSYAIDSVTANRLAMQEYDSMQSVHSTNHRPYDSSALVNSQTAFERYDPNYTLQRTSMYSPYCQPTLEELASQQKYLLEQQQQHQQHHQPPLMKTEPDDSNNGPVYPRPIYHAYDPTGKDSSHPSHFFTPSHLS